MAVYNPLGELAVLINLPIVGRPRLSAGFCDNVADRRKMRRIAVFLLTERPVVHAAQVRVEVVTRGDQPLTKQAVRELRSRLEAFEGVVTVDRQPDGQV